MTELAHLLDRLPLRARVERVAFTLEEPTTPEGLGLFRGPYGGSAIHAASLLQEGAHSGLKPRLSGST